MKNNFRLANLVQIVLAGGLAIASHATVAAVVDSADVAGYKTFQDTNTGRVWLDLNNFFNMTPNQLIAAASAAGFTFATRADVEGLLSPLPLSGGEWSSYKAVMGDAPNRELIWGVYDDGGDPFGWAYAYDSNVSWSFADDQNSGTWVPNGGTADADMNIWAYKAGTGPSIPEPGTLALLGIGLAGLAAKRKRK